MTRYWVVFPKRPASCRARSPRSRKRCPGISGCVASRASVVSSCSGSSASTTSTGCPGSSFYAACSSRCRIATPPPPTTSSVCRCSRSRSWAMPCREASCSSSGLLPVISLRSRLGASSYTASTERGHGTLGVLTGDEFPCSSKANPSSLSRSATKTLVHPSPPSLEGLGRECGVDHIDVLRVISAYSGVDDGGRV
jgi:hypothetical protein